MVLLSSTFENLLQSLLLSKIANMSSMYLKYSLDKQIGLSEKIFSCECLKKKFAIANLRGEPIVSPSICLYKKSFYIKSP